MTKIDRVIYRVQNPAHQTRFYCDVLGMHETGDNCVGYSDGQAGLKFIQADDAYIANQTDLYWKIALSVPNIELAVDQLRKAGVACSDPRQFEDVGYLAHFTDPEGFQIELIDHAFKGNRATETVETSLLGGGAHLSLVTLRTSDIERDEPVFVSWGMQKLSEQPLPAYGFTLHFYAFSESPPDSDLTSVTNRTWVYQRPYTVLELQHVPSVAQPKEHTDAKGGFDGLRFSGPEAFPPYKKLKIAWS